VDKHLGFYDIEKMPPLFAKIENCKDAGGF
jgi:hypothetical protein